LLFSAPQRPSAGIDGATLPRGIDDNVAEYGFFYGTLMAGFDRRRRAGIDNKMTYRGRGHIVGALFDLGIYPAAVPSTDGRVWGEVYEFCEVETVLAALDDIEGYTQSDPDRSLYTRHSVRVTLDEGPAVDAWVYFYNAPLGAAPRIPSGDYLAHIRVR
jgi:gamma-glutamylcyclotransferase (GGCT)/AIG2-like uncharacterized protein YtfP